MSAASRDHTTPFKQKNNKANRRQYEPPNKVRDFTCWEMGDSRDSSVTVQAENIDDACFRYAEFLWDGRTTKQMIYAKIKNERYIRCIHPDGRIDIMGF
tara:strand:+ start:477 stop:773 length:297 start_codon:yes stop_codon:yes gene_type:complete